MPREGNDLPRSEMPSSASSSRFACSSSSAESFDADRVVHHSLVARSAFRHSNDKPRTRFGFCNLMITTRGHDQSSPRPSPAPVLSPGSRFDGLTRLESHADLRRRPGHTSRYVTSLYALVRVSGLRWLSLSLRAHAAPARVRRAGDEPRVRCVRRRSPPLLHDAPSCDDPPRHHGERRGPRPASSCL